jgi:hypothetical protein
MCSIKFNYVHDKFGQKFNMYYQIQICIRQTWPGIQYVLSISYLYTTKLARNSICSIKFNFVHDKFGQKFNMYYQIQICVRQTWPEIQSVVLISYLYTTKLARNSICSIKLKFVYDKTEEKFNL